MMIFLHMILNSKKKKKARAFELYFVRGFFFLTVSHRDDILLFYNICKDADIHSLFSL